MRLLVLVSPLWARLLVVGVGGSLVQATTKLRPHYDRGQHFQPFYSPTTTQIPQHIPPKILNLNILREFLERLESMGLVIGGQVEVDC